MTKRFAPVVSPIVFASFVTFISFALFARPASAQIYEAVGTRAQGMGGAFVAVADDASATWWNPAGLASGAYVSMVIERTEIDDPGKPAATGPARRDQSTSFALALPSLGLSYYHFNVGEILPVSGPIAGTGAVRQDQEAAAVELRALSYSRFGATIGQSIGQHLVVASTFALLKGGVGAGAETGTAQSVDDATNLDVGSETHGDIDLGAMIRAGSFKFGASVKHMTQPSFGTGSSEVMLGRQARAGVAFSTTGGSSPLTLAADVDLTKTPTVNGDAQHAAGGVEVWLDQRRFAVRGGLSENLVGAKRTATSAGLSASLKSGVYVDGALTFGDETTRSGWGLTLRATF